MCAAQGSSRLDGSRRSSSGPPLVVGIAGDSAAGKTTLARELERILGRERVSRLCADDYHVLGRGARADAGLTPLDPSANDLDGMARDVARLVAGGAVDKPVYDHATGELRGRERVESRDVLVVEGLLAFGTTELLSRTDLAIYLDPDEELRCRWKIRRDCERRGYVRGAVVRELDRRRTDAAQHVHPQRPAAHAVVRLHGTGGSLDDDGGALHGDGHRASLLVRRTLLGIDGWSPNEAWPRVVAHLARALRRLHPPAPSPLDGSSFARPLVAVR